MDSLSESHGRQLADVLDKDEQSSLPGGMESHDFGQAKPDDQEVSHRTANLWFPQLADTLNT